MKQENPHTIFNKGATWLLLLLTALVVSVLPGSALAQTDADAKAYAGFESSTQTLTFYYGTERSGYDKTYVVDEKISGDPGWYKDGINGQVKTVVFNSSFKIFQPKSLAKWFYNFRSLTEVKGIENLNTSKVTDMSQMFRGCHALGNLDLSGLDVSKVEDFSYTFYECWGLQSLTLGEWHTLSATNMDRMFYNCSGFDELDLSSFSTSNVTNMERMLMYCFNVKTIYASSKFTTENVTNSKNMFNGDSNLVGAISYDADKIDAAYANAETGYFTIKCRHIGDDGKPLWGEPEHHDATCVEGEYNLYTCSNCHDTKKEYITDVPNPNNHSIEKRDLVEPTCKDSGMKEHYMCTLCKKTFLDAEATKEVDPSTLLIEPDPKRHDLHKYDATEPTCAKDGCKQFWMCSICQKVYLDAEATQLALQESDFIIQKYGHKLNAEGSCQRCGLKVMTLNGVTAELQGIANTYWDIFSEGEGETAVYGLRYPDSGEAVLTVTLASDKDFMFSFNMQGASSAYYFIDGLKQLNAGENAIYLKAGKHKLAIDFNSLGTLTLSGIVATTDFTPVPQPKVVYNADTKTLTFYSSDALPADVAEKDVYSVPEIVEGSLAYPWFPSYMRVEKAVFDKSFKILKPKSCAYWFIGMENLLTIDGLENLDVSEAVSLQAMFEYCESLEMLDLSNFNTSKVKNMRYMFQDCTNLNTIYAGDSFSTENVESGGDMFIDCRQLKGAIAYDSNKTSHNYANYTTGYFTKPCSHQDENGASVLVKVEEMAATCLKPAYTLYHCGKCDKDMKTYTGEPDQTKHVIKLMQDAVAPDCSHEGTKDVYKCNVCGRQFLKDDNGNYSAVESESEVTLPPLGHELDASYACSRCGKTDLRYAFLQIPEGVKAVIADNEYPWQLVDESNPQAGLKSSNKGLYVTDSSMKLYLTSEKPFETAIDYKVSSEENFDELIIAKDGEKFASFSGEKSGSCVVAFAAGTHRLELIYSKDSGTDKGDDIAVLTQLSIKQTEEYSPTMKAAVVYNQNDNSVTFKAIEANSQLADGDVYVSYINLDDVEAYPEWVEALIMASSVRVDESFRQFRPKSTMGWFGYSLNVKEIEGLENLNTSETENMESMFYQCVSLKSLDLSRFNTSKVRNFGGMFVNCLSLAELDITSFSMESANTANAMFAGCSTLENIYVNKSFSFEGMDYSDVNAAFAECYYLSGAKPYSMLDNPRLAANYRDGYLKTYYKVGDERHEIFGDMTVDELALEQDKSFMTHDAFHARKATMPVVITDEANVFNIGTICLPYAVKPSDDYTLYAVKQISDNEMPTSQTRRTAIEKPAGTIVLEIVDGTLPAGQPAVYRAKKTAFAFTAADADIVEQPIDDETLARDGYLLSGSFTEQDAADGYVLQGNDFVSIAQLKGDSETYRISPLTAYLKSMSSATLSTDRLTPSSADGAFSGISFVRSLSDGTAQIYDINGVRLDTFKKGINIIRRSDGKTQKVVVR